MITWNLLVMQTLTFYDGHLWCPLRQYLGSISIVNLCRSPLYLCVNICTVLQFADDRKCLSGMHAFQDRISIYEKWKEVAHVI